MAQDVQVLTGTKAKVAVRLCNFLTGKSALLKSHQDWLDQQLKPVVRSLNQPWVNIVGYASRLGDATFNLALSQKRCEAVKTVVVGYSPQAKVLPFGLGESQSGPNERDNDGYWRAVEVFVYDVKPPTPTPPPPSHESVRAAIIKAHGIVERTTWGTIPPKADKLVPDWDYDSIVIHHSGNSGMKNPTEIERKHMLTNGYDDVGYHYMIHPGGTIYEGRSILNKGSHVKAANGRKIGVLMMGDYDAQIWDDDDDLTRSHLQKLKDLIKTLKKQFPGMKYLGGHLEFAAAHGDERTCPGSMLIAELDGLRKEFGLAVPPTP